MFGPEVAMDELAEALGIDPVELRIRNEPEVDPETGKPFSSRHLVECLREGAERFGWADATRGPRPRRDGDWLVGTGVASSVYPTMRQAGSRRRPSRFDGRPLRRRDRRRRPRHRGLDRAAPDRRRRARRAPWTRSTS